MRQQRIGSSHLSTEPARKVDLFVRCRWLAALFLSTLLTTSQAANFTLESFPPSAGQIVGNVTSDGSVWLTLTAKPPEVDVTKKTKGTQKKPPLKVTLTLDQFRDKQGKLITIKFIDENGIALDKINIPITERFIIQLNANEAVAGGEYSGGINVTGDNQTEFFPILLKREAPKPLIYQTIPTDTSEVSVNAPVDGISSIQFDAGSDAYVKNNANATFTLGTFFSENDGRIAQIYFLDKAKKDGRQTELTTPIDARKLNLTLDASEIPFDDTYDGELNVKFDNYDASTKLLKITRRATDPNAQLVVESLRPIEVICHRIFACQPEESIKVGLWEQSGKRPLTDISLLPVAESEGIEEYMPLSGSLKVDLETPSPISDTQNGSKKQHSVIPLWPMDSENTTELQHRSIPAGRSGALRITFNNELPLGKHNIPLQVSASNVDSGKWPTLVVGVMVKHPAYFPFLILFISVLLSYFLTKIIRTQLLRIDLKNRINRIKEEDWFKKDWSIMPVVRTKALLAQVNKVIDRKGCRKFWFFPPPLAGHVTTLENRLMHLKRLCDLISYWNNVGHDALVSRRAKKVLRDVVDAFVNAPLHSELDTSVLTQLAILEEWKDSAKLVNHYWLNLKGDILLLQSQVRLNDYNFSFDSKGASIKLATFPTARNKQDFEQLSTAFEAFQNSLQANISPEGKAVLNKASNQLAAILPGSLDTIIDALQTISNTLDEVDDKGLTPVLEAVKNVQKQISNSTLTSGWPYLKEARKMIDSNQDVAADQLKRELLEYYEKISCWSPVRLTETLNELQRDLKVSQTSDREIVRRLLSDLKPEDQPKNLKEAIEREISYAKLKVINQAKGEQIEPLLDDLLKAERDGESLNTLFDIVDNCAWDSLCNTASIEVQTYKVPSYELIRFNIDTKNDTARNSYLYKHGAIYEWEIDYTPSSAKQGQNSQPLRVKTDRPYVAQFIPMETDNVKVTVTIRYDRRNKKTVPPITKEFSINVGEPAMFSFVAAFQWVELAALIIALIVALGTGMQSQVYENALSGSLPAYFTLFVWGFAADQIKNLLENIRTLTGAENK